MRDNSAAGDIYQSGLTANSSVVEAQAAPYFEYHVECLDADGNLKWEETFRNKVTRVGAAYVMDMAFAAGAAAQTWYLGLISSTSYTTGPSTADTAASHAGWTEATVYSSATRPTITTWVASTTASDNVDKVASAAVSYSINGTDTIKGCFVITNSTKSGTTGTLYSAGTFTDRAVQSGDTLNVTPTLRMTVA